MTRQLFVCDELNNQLLDFLYSAPIERIEILRFCIPLREAKDTSFPMKDGRRVT